VLFARVIHLKLIHESKLYKFKNLEIDDCIQEISKKMKKVQDMVAKDVFMILIKQARDQAFKVRTGQPEATGESHIGKTDIIGKKFDMEFMVSAPNNLIEEAKKEILKLRQQVESLMDKEATHQSTIKIFQKEISRLEHRESDLEKEIKKFKLKMKEPNKKLKKCRPS
jgi:chromosome segregation ATPase